MASTADKCPHDRVDLRNKVHHNCKKKKKKEKRESKKVVGAFRKTLKITRLCSRCRRYIKCRANELEPRKNKYTNKLEVHLCYVHRFVEATKEKLVQSTDSEGEQVLVCRMCMELAQHNCMYCKCFLKGDHACVTVCCVRAIV